MPPENFEMLLSWIGPKIKKVTTKMREPISVGPRLCVTLTHFSPVSYFYTPRKRQKTFGFLTFSGGIEM